MTTEATHTNVFLRHDTIFGTFETIGAEFGFNPNWLRIPLAASLLASPTGAIAFYLGLSLVVLAARFVFRSRVVPAISVAAEPAAIEANDDQRELIAA